MGRTKEILKNNAYYAGKAKQTAGIMRGNKINEDKPLQQMNDSVLLPFDEKVKKASELSLYYLAQFEGFETTAYHCKADKNPNLYTIGFGNTTHPNGRPVRPGDKLTSKEQAVEYVNAYFKDAWTSMQKYLPVDKMTPEQMAVVADLMFNGGKNLGSKKYEKLVPAINDYVNDPSEENKKTLVAAWDNTAISSKCPEQHHARRRQEIMAFCGDVRIGIGPSKEELAGQPKPSNYIDIQAVAVGAGNMGSYGNANSSNRQNFVNNLREYREYPVEAGDTATNYTDSVYNVRGYNLDVTLDRAFKSSGKKYASARPRLNLPNRGKSR